MENRGKIFPSFLKKPPQPRCAHGGWGTHCTVRPGHQLLAASLGPHLLLLRTIAGKEAAPKACSASNQAETDELLKLLKEWGQTDL